MSDWFSGFIHYKYLYIIIIVIIKMDVHVRS